MLDYIRAHRKVLLTLAGLLAIQFLDSETADWVVATVDTLLVLVVPNDQAAVDRVWKKNRR